MSQKYNEMLEQLETMMNELKDAQQQTASSITITNRNTPVTFQKLMSKWSWKLAMFLLLFVLLGTAIGSGVAFLFSCHKAQLEQGSFVEQMHDLSSLATSQAYIKAVIEKEDNELFGHEIKANIPGTKRKLLLIVPGTVTAGVDFKQVHKEDVHIDQAHKKVTITLPKAQLIQEPSLDLKNAQTFSVEGVFRKEVNWDEAYHLADEAKKQIEAEAISQGLLRLAEENADRTLKEFLAQLNYTVDIQYKKKN